MKSETEFYWLYNKTKGSLIDIGVRPESIHLNINDYGMLQCELTKDQAESLIPQKTLYCSGCPFHDIIPHFPKQSNGYCHFLKRGDDSLGLGLLWDSCKHCGIGEDFENEV